MADNEKKLQHVAIIMDGNGRWAKSRNLSRSSGHKAGADNVVKVMQLAKKHNIKYLTLYAFSTENWKRPKYEVDALMHLLEEFLDNKISQLQAEKVELKVTGRVDGLPSGVRNKLQKAVAATSGNGGGTLILALNYGGRAEIVDAAKKIARQVLDNQLKIDEISEEIFGKNLYLPEVPDPDFLIRTSGEMRLSNFLLWELSYAEFYVTNVMWPDFDEAEFEAALAAYFKRERRMGEVK